MNFFKQKSNALITKKFNDANVIVLKVCCIMNEKNMKNKKIIEFKNELVS